MADIGSRHPAASGSLTADHTDPELWQAEPLDTPERRPPAERQRTRDPVAPPLREPPEAQMRVRDQQARSPERIIEIGSREIDAARDITIRADKYGPAYCDIRVWNLDSRTWAHISELDRIDVKLGWNGSDVETVFRGRVLTKRRRSRRADRAFIIRGLSDHGRQLKRTYSASFNDLPPHRIARLIIEDVGIERGYISTVSDRLGEYWSVSKHKELRHWFDQLVARAERQTGEEWVWYIEGGKFYFHPILEQVTVPVQLSKERSIQRATPVGEPRLAGLHNHELVTHCEPIVRRGLTVQVPDVETMPSGQHWRVKSYVFESSTTEGRHHTYAVVSPLVDRDELYGEFHA